jgi:putative membrane protein
LALAAALQNGWTLAQSGAPHSAATAAVLAYMAAQAVLFAGVAALTAIPAVRRLVTPRFMKRQHVHARAMEQFTHRLHATQASTGILIYASLAERQVEIIADEDIHEKVAPGEWDRAVKAAVGPIAGGDVAGGLIAAIAICGEALAQHFPAEVGVGRAADGERMTEV